MTRRKPRGQLTLWAPPSVPRCTTCGTAYRDWPIHATTDQHRRASAAPVYHMSAASIRRQNAGMRYIPSDVSVYDVPVDEGPDT